MVNRIGSPAGDLQITAELWVNEAFVPAVSCHDVFEQSGIVFMRAHVLSHSAHSLALRAHFREGGRERKIHQSLSHAEGGSLKATVSSLTFSLTRSLMCHSWLSSWSSSCRLTFLGLSSCPRWASRMEGPAVARSARWQGLAWDWGPELGKTHWPNWWLRRQTWALWEAASPPPQLPPWLKMLISCL